MGQRTMPIVLYKRQRQILDYIHQFLQQHNYSPTLAEIGKALGMRSPATVHEHLITLEQKGFIRRVTGQARGIEILYDNANLSPTESHISFELPLLGYIHAGKPLEPYEDANATFKVSPNLIPPGKKCYVLRVKGDSLIEDGIYSGDYVVLQKDAEVKEGDVVVALLETGLATLKKFYRENGQVKLMPANSTMEPIFATNVSVQGKMVALVRKYI